jgi:hypothetical protein
MTPELKFKPVKTFTLSTFAQTLTNALRDLESAQRDYNDAVKWAEFALDLEEGKEHAGRIHARVERLSDALLAQQLKVEQAHREYRAAMTTAFTGSMFAD